jgi:methionyl-tRNA synthetase
MKRFYLTTTLPYVNAEPHIGFALEMVQADTFVRYHALTGHEIFFNTGTDEHGLKIYRKAKDEGKDTQTYTDEYAAKFNQLKETLNLSYNHFIRTTDPHHVAAAQEFWKRCAANGDIYKAKYQVKYCVGCELEKTESELVDEKCPLHPSLELETLNEENYFFKWSKYQKPLLDFYKNNPEFVRPQSKFNEIINFVKAGLKDFSISRLKDKLPWGVPAPDDDDHVMYVWFDALVNYISTTGWPENDSEFKKWWPGVQVAGKDNLRQQSAMWQSMLMSAGLPNSKQIYIHGFITSDGQKMSKSLGNVLNPVDIVNQFSTDALRYYLLKEIPSLDDGDFSVDRMKDVYDSDLANELGNLVTRITTIAEKDALEVSIDHNKDWLDQLPLAYRNEKGLQALERFEFNIALEELWKEIKNLNKQINEVEPWKLAAEDRNNFLTKTIAAIHSIGAALLPFMPTTAGTILNATSGIIKKCPPMFPKNK